MGQATSAPSSTDRPDRTLARGSFSLRGLRSRQASQAYMPQPHPTASSAPFPQRRFRPIPDAFNNLDQVQQALRDQGLESSNIIVAVDFSKSNDGRGKLGLHHIGPDANDYEEAIAIIGRTLAHFDDDDLIPAYGFGDATTHDTSVFSFLPDNEPIRGLGAVLDRYRNLAPHVRRAGPTSFAPAIRQATRIVAESDGQYHILVLVADGQINSTGDSRMPSHQEQETIEAIVEASNHALSIVMVGVGDGPWDKMHQFDDRLQQRTFDNFQFVCFSDIVRQHPHDQGRREAAFALAALQEIPEQYRAIQRLRMLGARNKPARSVQVKDPPPFDFLHTLPSHHSYTSVPPLTSTAPPSMYLPGSTSTAGNHQPASVPLVSFSPLQTEIDRRRGAAAAIGVPAARVHPHGSYSTLASNYNYQPPSAPDHAAPRDLHAPLYGGGLQANDYQQHMPALPENSLQYNPPPPAPTTIHLHLPAQHSTPYPSHPSQPIFTNNAHYIVHTSPPPQTHTAAAYNLPLPIQTSRAPTPTHNSAYTPRNGATPAGDFPRQHAAVNAHRSSLHGTRQPPNTADARYSSFSNPLRPQRSDSSFTSTASLPAAPRHSMRRSLQHMISRISTHHPRVPSRFICPITRLVMDDPVVASDGHTYERSAIERHLRQHTVPRSPVCRIRFPTKEVWANISLRAEISDARNRGEIP